MKPHIAQTVADLRQERERLDDIIATLERYGAATDDAHPLDAAAEAAPEPQPQPTARPAKRGRKPKSDDGSMMDQVRAAILKIKRQQFKVAELKEHVPHLNAEQLGNACSKLRTKKELMKTGFGTYARTDRFGLGGTGAPSETEADYRRMRESLNIHVPEVELKGTKVSGE